MREQLREVGGLGNCCVHLTDDQTAALAAAARAAAATRAITLRATARACSSTVVGALPRRRGRGRARVQGACGSRRLAREDAPVAGRPFLAF